MCDTQTLACGMGLLSLGNVHGVSLWSSLWLFCRINESAASPLFLRCGMWWWLLDNLSLMVFFFLCFSLSPSKNVYLSSFFFHFLILVRGYFRNFFDVFNSIFKL